MTMLTLTTGSVFIMWLGEQITERGVGNGMSLLIFAGIVVGLPRGVADLFAEGQTAGLGRVHRSRDAAADCGDDRGGRLHRLCGAQRAANSGAVRQARCGPQGHGRPVDPPAAAGELRRRDAGHLRVVGADLAADGGSAAQGQQRYSSVRCSARCGGASRCTPLLYAVGIIFFAYFYVSIVFNPNEVADNMRKYGGFIPGHSAGRADGELHQRHSDAHHAGGRAVPDPDLVHSGVDDRRYPPQPPVGSGGQRSSSGCRPG